MNDVIYLLIAILILVYVLYVLACIIRPPFFKRIENGNENPSAVFIIDEENEICGVKFLESPVKIAKKEMVLVRVYKARLTTKKYKNS